MQLPDGTKIAERWAGSYKLWTHLQTLTATTSIGASYGLQLIGELSRAEAQLAALQWRPITPENLPKVGGEVGAYFETDTHFSVCEFGGSETALTDEQLFLEITHDGWTHFRPINPPAQEQPVDAQKGKP